MVNKGSGRHLGVGNRDSCADRTCELPEKRNFGAIDAWVVVGGTPTSLIGCAYRPSLSALRRRLGEVATIIGYDKAIFFVFRLPVTS